MSAADEMIIGMNLINSKTTLVIGKQVESNQACFNSVHNLIGISGSFLNIDCNSRYAPSDDQMEHYKSLIPKDGVIFFRDIHNAPASQLLQILTIVMYPDSYRVIMSSCDPAPAAIANRSDVIRL